MLRSTVQTAELLERAWALPVAAKYSPLRSQGFRSICGPTSVSNVLRSVGVDAGANPLRGFGLRAMSLEQVVREGGEVMPAGWAATVVRPSSVDELREELRFANDPAHRYIANFSRGPLFGHGGGHHSPIGGYLEAEDLVFVLDVNKGYGPWLAPVERMFAAMNTVDRGDGRTRGLARFEQR
ncbi:MAG: phytochelatin synthase family protein [Myxococcaceae bacterium]